MRKSSGSQPPLACTLSVRVAGWLVPAFARSEWRTHWNAELRSWWILYERGEISPGVYDFIRAAASSAMSLRLERMHLSRSIRSPWFVLISALVALGAIAVLSQGFAVTQSLIALALGPKQNIRYIHENKVFVYTAPIVFAFATAIAVIGLGPLPVRHKGWKYWTFFVAKTAALVLIVPLLWIEGGNAFRSQFSSFGARIVIGGLVLALVFIALFSYALRWSFVDQRQRCRVCLRRLTLPVTFGSWGSVFEPATTELLCEDGHGSLAVSDAQSGEPDRWISLDATWRGL